MAIGRDLKEGMNMKKEDFEVTRKEEVILEEYLSEYAKKKISEFCDKEFVQTTLRLAISDGVKEFLEQNYDDTITRIAQEVGDRTKKLIVEFD